MRMSQPERFEILVLGSGTGGKLVAWHMAQAGRRTAVVERRWIGGSCVNVACMPSKNEISSAKVAYLAHHAAQYGMVGNSVAVDMAGHGESCLVLLIPSCCSLYRPPRLKYELAPGRPITLCL
jgi:choline dehydrogenase-like flavoprotein